MQHYYELCAPWCPVRPLVGAPKVLLVLTPASVEKVSLRPQRNGGGPDSPDVCSNVLAIRSARRGTTKRDLLWSDADHRSLLRGPNGTLERAPQADPQALLPFQLCCVGRQR